MYQVTVDEQMSEIVVSGPEGFERRLPANGFGIVLRANLEDEWDACPCRYVVPFSAMSRAELIACALEIFAYPA